MSHAPEDCLRPDAAAFKPDWAAKSDELLVKKPLYHRGWFLRLMLGLGGLCVMAVAVGGFLLLRWHREQMADLAAQRHSVERFIHSPAFETFARQADAQLVAAHNFIGLRPGIAATLLPAIATAEKIRHQVPWAIELPPLTISTADRPERVQAAIRNATDLLAARGYDFDATRTADARRTFLRLLAPQAQRFLAENATASFPALFVDRRMQDQVLTAYAARAGRTVADTERAFVFYTLIGPSLWQELESKATLARR